jgi:hypothetical protein
MTTLLIMYVVFGILLVALSIPLIRRKIPPNGLYGFRIPKTLNHPDLWYEANYRIGWWLLVSGAAIVLAGVGLSFVPGISVDAYALSVLAVLVLVLTPGVIRVSLFIRKY